MKPKILVVAHKPTSFLVLGQVLLKFGCEMITAHPDPVELDRAQKLRPWMVLVRPPAQPSEQRRCLGLVKERFQNKETPILACVLTPQEERAVHEYLGAVQVLVGSPLRLSDLYARMQEMLRMIKRNELRIKTELVVAHREPGMYREDFFYYDKMVSLSCNGCFIHTKNPYPVDSEVELIFCLDGEAGSCHLAGKVRRHGTDVDGREGMGILFETLSEAMGANLEKYLLGQLTNVEYPVTL